MPRSTFGSGGVSPLVRAERTVAETLRRVAQQQQNPAVFDPLSILMPYVFSPLMYGARGDGVTDDGAAIRRCLVAARTWAGANVEELTPRIPRVDFGGLVYATSAQIEVPGGQGVTIENGALVPAPGFTSDLFLMRVGDPADPAMRDGFRNVNTTVRRFYFDNKHVGGGLLLENFMRATVTDCLFAHYETVGLKTTRTGSHELKLYGCQFGEYWWGETEGVGYNRPDLFVGTGIEINSPDNHLSDLVIQLSRLGLKVNAQANLFDQIHIWTGYVRDPATSAGPTAALTYMSTGLWITANASLSKFSQLYMDGCEILWENPWKTSVTDSIFLNGFGDATRAMIRFKPMTVGEFASGVVITGCSFQVQNGGLMKMTSIDASAGTFNPGQVTGCLIEGNDFTGVTDRKYTTPMAAFSSNATHTWTFDFSGMLPFGDVIQMPIVTHYCFSGQSTIVRVTDLTGAVVTVGSFDPLSPATPKSINATIYIEAHVNQRDLNVPVVTLP